MAFYDQCFVLYLCPFAALLGTMDRCVIFQHSILIGGEKFSKLPAAQPQLLRSLHNLVKWILQKVREPMKIENSWFDFVLSLYMRINGVVTTLTSSSTCKKPEWNSDKMLCYLFQNDGRNGIGAICSCCLLVFKWEYGRVFISDIYLVFYKWRKLKKLLLKHNLLFVLTLSC